MSWFVSRSLLRALLGAGLAASIVSPALAASVERAEVTANGELTEEGRTAPRPSPQHPVYYVPVINGYQQRGKIVAGEEPPKRELMLKQLGRALARQGYVLQALRPDASTTTPSLILAIEWGYLNPLVLEHGALDLGTGSGGSMAAGAIRNDPTQSTSTDFNQNEMVELVAGPSIRRGAAFSSFDWDRLTAAVGEGRYYIVVSAYDFQASLKGEQRLLWRTRMSTPRQGVWMNDIVPALVITGAPLFGRDTELPAWKEYPLREGRVELGEAEVRELDVALPPANANPPPVK